MMQARSVWKMGDRRRRGEGEFAFAGSTEFLREGEEGHSSAFIDL